MSGEGRDPWEPLTKSLVAAALGSLFGVPPAVTTGGWDTMRGLFGGATSKPVPDELLRAVQKWRKTEGLGDDLIEPILANTTDILRKYGLSHQEVLQFKAMPAVCAAEVNKRATSLLVSLGEREAASVRRLVEELYADLTRLDGTRSAIEEAYKKYILHLVVENQKRAQDTIEQHSREQTDRREQQLDRARKSVQGKLFPRSDENPARVPFQESGLYHEAVEALRYDWAEDVADRCQALADRVAAEPGRDCAKLSQDLRRIDTHRPFLEILRKIRDLDLSLNLDWVRRSNGQSAAAGVLPTLRWLRSQRLTPSFRWILPVTGDWGSGKTRLFQQLADDALDQGRQLMFLRPGHSHGAEKMLLDQVRQDWSLDMSSFEDLHDWILKANTSALIVVDDVETIIRDDPHWVEDFRHRIFLR